MATYNGASYLKEQLDSLAQHKDAPIGIDRVRRSVDRCNIRRLSDFEKTAPFAVSGFFERASGRLQTEFYESGVIMRRRYRRFLRSG